MKDYEAFFEARENNAVYAFLGLTAPPGSKVGVYIYHSLYFILCSFLLMAGYFTCSEGVTVNLHTGLIFTVSTDWLSDFNITATQYVLPYLESAVFPGGIFLPLLLPENPCSVLMSFWYPQCGATLLYSNLMETLLLVKEKQNKKSLVEFFSSIFVSYHGTFFQIAHSGEKVKDQLVFALRNAYAIWMKRYCHTHMKRIISIQCKTNK